jgi:hypothetical protein
MNVSTVWLLYILSILISYVILLVLTPKMLIEIRVLLSFLVGGISIFLSTSSLTINNEKDQVWLGVLHIIAYSIPIVISLYILWKLGLFNKKSITDSDNQYCVVTNIYDIVDGTRVLKSIEEVCKPNSNIFFKN